MTNFHNFHGNWNDSYFCQENAATIFHNFLLEKCKHFKKTEFDEIFSLFAGLHPSNCLYLWSLKFAQRLDFRQAQILTNSWIILHFFVLFLLDITRTRIKYNQKKRKSNLETRNSRLNRAILNFLIEILPILCIRTMNCRGIKVWGKIRIIQLLRYYNCVLVWVWVE